MNYLDTVNKRTLEYFKVLESDFPEWLWEYINTEALFKQNYISVTCGTIYSDLFESSKYSKVYDIWKTAKMVNISQQQPENVYFVQHGAKKRYINPLVNGKRITLIEKEAKELIDKVLNYDMSAYIWLDFDF